jgi:hypothetical protein
MKSVEWKTYRTRFLVKARQLSSSLSFVDHLGRRHCGRKGDYLVESCDGVLSIAPRQIFEDIYVAMSLSDHSTPTPDRPAVHSHLDSLDLDHVAIESLEIERISDEKISPRVDGRRRKSPQPVRDRRASPRIGLLRPVKDLRKDHFA